MEHIEHFKASFLSKARRAESGCWEWRKKGRDRKASGEQQGHSRLSAEQVEGIRTDPRGYKALGRALGVHWSTIRAIRKGRNWKSNEGAQAQ